ncbi:MAG TPA: Zn-ribbon containing protein [Candidatus Nanoarchaeia archaeon]|nr:Zn-ribbon containing protein [Candidatus Nanoarchaeia archaeon]
MPHQCVRCNTFYEDGSAEILKGCTCGARLFFYIKKKDIEYGKELLTNLTEEDKTNIEKDVAEVLSIREGEPDTPVVLDLESIRVVKPGKFEIDLVHLFKKDPLIIKLEEGKYMIDLPQAFKKAKEDSDEKEKK